MKMFLGEFNPSITEGSRIALPKKHREQITGGMVVLAKGFEKNVLVYDQADWAEKAQKQIEDAKNDNASKIKKGDLERYLYTSATEAPIDSQGRFVLPANLMGYAELSNKTAVIGVGDHVEIWDLDNWQTYIAKVSAVIKG